MAVSISGTVTLDGSAIGGCRITVIDAGTRSVVGTTTTASDGTYSVSVETGTTVHVLAAYESADGSQYSSQTRAFVTADETAGSDTNPAEGHLVETHDTDAIHLSLSEYGTPPSRTNVNFEFTSTPQLSVVVTHGGVRVETATVRVLNVTPDPPEVEAIVDAAGTNGIYTVDIPSGDATDTFHVTVEYEDADGQYYSESEMAVAAGDHLVFQLDSYTPPSATNVAFDIEPPATLLPRITDAPETTVPDVITISGFGSNIGDKTADQVLELRANGAVQDSVSLTVGGGALSPVDLTWDATGVATGTYNVRLASSDAHATQSVTLRSRWTTSTAESFNHGASVYGLDVHPTQDYIAVRDETNANISIYSHGDWTEVTSFSPSAMAVKETLPNMAFGPDGNWLFALDDTGSETPQYLSVYDVSSSDPTNWGRIQHIQVTDTTLISPDPHFHSLGVDPLGRYVTATSNYEDPYQIAVVDTSDWTTSQLGTTHTSFTAQFSPDGSVLVSGVDDQNTGNASVYAVDDTTTADNWTEVTLLSDGVSSGNVIRFTADGNYMTVADTSTSNTTDISVYEVGGTVAEDWNYVDTLSSMSSTPLAQVIDGSSSLLVGTSTSDSTASKVRIFDLPGGSETSNSPLENPTSYVQGMAISTRHDQLFYGDADGTVYIHSR